MSAPEGVVKRFADIYWHDRCLKSIAVSRSSTDDDTVCLGIDFTGSGKGSLTEVRLIGAVELLTSIDLVGKRQCGDAIGAALCYESSAWMTQLARESPFYSYKDLYHFHFTLIAPGGTLDVIARDFDVAGNL
jgi:hypothetical protein